MPRYVTDYQGISGQPERGEGMDPNHRNGYHGMRMRAHPGQAAYGWHRWTHEADLETHGGYGGRQLSGSYDRDHRSADRGSRYDLELHHAGRGRSPWPIDDDHLHAGGVRDLRYDDELLREFNADSIRFRNEGRYRGRGGSGRPRLESGGRGGRSAYDHGFRRGYGNRGMSDGGYTDPWTWGPMRGAR